MSRRLIFPVVAIVAALTLVALSAQSTRADQRDFTFTNNSSSTIMELYVAHAASDDWGSDILGVDVLGPGQSVFVYFSRFEPDLCTYDLRVVLDDGSAAVQYGVDLCSTTDVSYP